MQTQPQLYDDDSYEMPKKIKTLNKNIHFSYFVYALNIIIELSVNHGPRQKQNTESNSINTFSVKTAIVLVYDEKIRMMTWKLSNGGRFF